MVLTITGIFPLFYYDPSSETVIYDGSYPLLRGAEMSKALDSTPHISFEVRGGLLMRQAHHWAALILPASLRLHILSIFFTGGFRRPRRWNWVLLNLVFVLVQAGGWSGYALPHDTLQPRPLLQQALQAGLRRRQRGKTPRADRSTAASTYEPLGGRSTGG